MRKYIIHEEDAQLVAMVKKKNTILERKRKSHKFGLLMKKFGNELIEKKNRLLESWELGLGNPPYV